MLQLIQGTTTDRDQELKDQASLVENLTGKVETYEEKLAILTEKLQQTEAKSESETENFTLKLEVKTCWGQILWKATSLFENALLAPDKCFRSRSKNHFIAVSWRLDQLSASGSYLFLQETQKYFQDTIDQRDAELQSLKEMLRAKETEIEQKKEDLKQVTTKHEREIQQILSKGEVNIQDEVC